MKGALVFIYVSFQSSLAAQVIETPPSMPDPGPLIEPGPVKFTFEAPGWYILAAIILVVCVVSCIRWLINYRKNAYRREALGKIHDLAQRSHTASEVDVILELLTLLKRAALIAFGRQAVASLSGNEWFAYLESKGKNTRFTQFEPTISAHIYSGIPVDPATVQEFTQLTKKWIKTHA